jgi:hypothetical protein
MRLIPRIALFATFALVVSTMLFATTAASSQAQERPEAKASLYVELRGGRSSGRSRGGTRT